MYVLEEILNTAMYRSRESSENIAYKWIFTLNNKQMFCYEEILFLKIFSRCIHFAMLSGVLLRIAKRIAASTMTIG
jgi:hypothetical protein